MNLINDPWIPVIRADGTNERIAPWQIVTTDNPIVDIAAPRPDFHGALYQFLIGLLQTAFAPEDHDEWLELWETPPSEIKLKEVFCQLSEAFYLNNSDGFSFMQDSSLALEGFEEISQLLVGEPGVNTVKKNQDHFIHSGNKRGVCAPCCATILYTLSLNGPPGGAGHMSGLIGNGPVATLIEIEGSGFWRVLWANVLPQYDFGESVRSCSDTVFPWMGRLKTSEKCKTKACSTGCEKCSVFPDEKSHLHVFWGMARRIKIKPSDRVGNCSVCGEAGEAIFDKYVTRPNGIRYMGGWSYPLSPIRFTDRETFPEPLRGNQMQKCYSDWLGITLQDDNTNIKAARNIRHFLDEKLHNLDVQSYSIHCYFYDMEPGQAKARCWYEQQMPLVHVNPDYQPLFIQFVSMLINAARDVVKELRTQVKAAWFSRPKDAKGDTSMIDSMFWQVTEPEFYQQLFNLSELPANARHMPSSVAGKWLKTLRLRALEVFDHWVLEGDVEDMDMKRITKARRELVKKLKTTKSLKDLEQIATATTEVA